MKKKMAALTEPLPHAPITMVFGLLEHLRLAPGGREDIYKLGGPLGYALDDLLPVTEAAKRLGLVKVDSGDIELTRQGGLLADAEEPERKKHLAHSVETLPLVADIRRALQAGGGRVSRQEFLERLQEHFSPVEAERQVSTALDWARYAELFDFDPDSEEFVLAS